MAKFIGASDIAKGVNWLEDWPLITAGTGCGKTHFMVHDLPQLIQDQTGKKIKSTLLLEPLNMLKNDVLRSYSGFAEGLHIEELADGFSADETTLKVACFGALGLFLNDGNQIARSFDLILLDEIDQLIEWSICHEGNLLVWDWVFKQKEQGNIVCGATATPGLLLDNINNGNRFHFVNMTPDFPVNLKSNNVTVVQGIKAQTFLKTVKPGPQNKYLVYCQSATRCAEMAKQFSDYGAGFIISKYQEKENKDGEFLCDVMEAQKVKDKENQEEEITLREYITKYQELPEGVNVLIINDAAVCGINIHDPLVKHVIAETMNLDKAKQARGRIRHDLESFTVVYARYKTKEEKPILGYIVDGETKPNPFAAAVKAYSEGWWWAMDYSEESKEFIREALAHETDNPITFLDAEKVRQDGRNNEAMSKLDIPAIFNFQEGQTEKVVSVEEIREAAKRHPIKKPNNDCYGAPTWIKKVNECGNAFIEKWKSRSYQGKPGTWYQVTNLQK